MKWLLILFIFPIVVNAQQLRKIDVESFKANTVYLTLKPDYDLFNFRFDLIRETETVQVNDSTSKTEASDYSKLGFDLGNYMFFDLNQNMCLRIDKLLSIDNTDDFIVKKETFPFRNSRVEYFQFYNGKFSHQSFYRNRYIEDFNVIQKDGQLDIYYKKKYRRSILKNDEGIFYTHKKSKINKIYNTGNNSFSTTKKSSRRSKYYIEDGNITLNNKYYINTNNDNNEIRISNWHKRKTDKPFYFLKFNDHEIIIYNRKMKGYLIKYSSQMVEIYYKKKVIKRYTRMN